MIAKNAVLNRLLEQDEQVLWTDSPEIWRLTAPSFLIYIFALPWTIFTFSMLLEMTDGLKWLPPATGIYPAWTPRFFFAIGVAVFLPGVWLLTAPFWAWRKARQTVYAVTDRRVMQFNVANPAQAQSLKLTGAVTLRMRSGIETTGDLDFVAGDEAERQTMLLKAVPRVREVIALLEKARQVA